MDFKDLTPEQQEMARACKSQEELVELVKSFGDKLSDEELEAVAGGLLVDIGKMGIAFSQACSRFCPEKFGCPDYHLGMTEERRELT
jgi:hypothetical protein